MVKFFHIITMCGFVLTLTACRESQKNKPIWEQVKITDLMPSTGKENAELQQLKTTNFNACVFEVPVENIKTVNGIWQMLTTQPMRFNNYEAFKANLFLAGFGQAQTWNKIAELLVAAAAKKTETNYLLLPEGQPARIAVAKLKSEQTVFYVPIGGRMEGVMAGPGTLVLQTKAEKIAGSRGVCDFTARPVFLSTVRSAVPQPVAREKTGEIVFDSVGFGLKMSPGDFLLLGPEKYVSDRMTLSSLFFTGSERRPVIRIFLFVCAGIAD